MNPLTACAGWFLVLYACAGAQSLYVDFGDPGSAHGVPSPAYGGAGRPGVWHAVSAQVTTGLVDTAGAPTGVTLSTSAPPILDECGHAGTVGEDAALYDDRWYFDPVTASMTLSGLEPGLYAVHLHVLVGPCVMMFSPLTVQIAGADPPSFDVLASAWNGMPEEGATYSTQYKLIGPGEDLEIVTFSPPGFTSYTQHCGLQIVRQPSLLAGCFGDGSAGSCPCGNNGASNAGCVNSTGVGARLVGGGSTSVGADDLRFTAHGLPTGRIAVLFAGTDSVAAAAGTPFGDGLRCAGVGIVRLGVRTADPQGTALWGPGIAGQGGWSPGESRRFQVWYRDLGGPCGNGFNLTHSVRAVFEL